MLFNSIEFLFIFLPIVFLIYFLIIKSGFKKYSNLWLLLSSLYFYSYYKIEYLPIMLSSILFNYSMSNIILRSKDKQFQKLILIITIVGNLLLLSYFKYFNFVIDTINSFNFIQFDTMKILLPLGISFFTFQQISFIYDTYKGEVEKINFLDYTLFVSFFPQLIAGPICTYKELVPQFQDITKKVIIPENIYRGLFFITIGLCKKVIFADNITPSMQNIIQNGLFNDFLTSWGFAFAATIRGYFDFSGYCDMAIGIAILFNIDIPINFNSPYKSLDISDFWRRWHITMGRFLKYNVYIPLGGSRRGEIRTYINLFIVFILMGIWHGANWCCILFGIFNGIFIGINKYWKKKKIEINKNLAIFITFTLLVFISPLMVLTDVKEYIILLKSMLGISTTFLPATISNFNIILHNQEAQLNIIILILSTIIVFGVKNSNELATMYIKSKNSIYTLVLAIIFIVSVLSITKDSEFIYFIF